MADFTATTKQAIFNEIRRNAGKAGAHIYIDAIADAVGKSRRTVSAVIAALKSEGHIIVDHHFGVNSRDRLPLFFRIPRGRRVPFFCAKPTSCLVESDHTTAQNIASDVPVLRPGHRTNAQRRQDAERMAQRVQSDVRNIVSNGVSTVRAAMYVRWHLWQSRGNEFSKRVALRLAEWLRTSGEMFDPLWQVRFE